MIDQKGKRQLGAAALKDLSFLTRIDNAKYSSPPHSPQAQSSVVDATRRFCREPAMRRQVLTVRISAHGGTSPHGRSRLFQLSAHNLDKLLDAASSLEEVS
jgi:hypothetical protein